MRTARDHLLEAAGSGTGRRGGANKPMPQSWLGRQRRYQQDAIFVSILGARTRVLILRLVPDLPSTSAAIDGNLS